MRYPEWQTLFDEAGKFHPDEKGRDLKWRYDTEIRRILNYPFRENFVRTNKMLRLGAEYGWVKEGKPYYKIHPLLIGQLARTNLDKIPAKFVEVPNNYMSINIRFSDDVCLPEFEIENGKPQFGMVDTKRYPAQTRSVMFCRIKGLLRPDQDEFVIHLDDGARTTIEGIKVMVLTTLHFSVIGDETFPETVKRVVAGYENDPNVSEPERLIYRNVSNRLMSIMSLVVAVGFLANSPEEGLVVPDVLNDDQNKLDEALKKGDQAAIDRLAQRARNRHKLGWNVGTNEMFVGEVPLEHQEKSEGAGRELKWSHIRTGHPHAVRVGEGRKGVKIKWFRPTRVRDDLPFKPTEGF